MTLEELCEKNRDGLAKLGVKPVMASMIFGMIWETAIEYAEGQEEMAMQIVADWLQI